MKVAIFSLLWPRTNFSAACVRTFGFVHSQLKEDQQTIFVSPSKRSKQQISDLQMFSNVRILEADPNDFEKMDFLLSKQFPFVPDVAIFDTFVCEEKFSHYVHTKFPNCLKVLDLQDMHSLRHARQALIEASQSSSSSPDSKQITETGEEQSLPAKLSEKDSVIEILRCGNLSHKASKEQQSMRQSDEFNREMASMLRSDVVITCSDYEYQLLRNQLNIHHAELITFFHETPDQTIQFKDMNFDRRKNFVWIGNQSHYPNADSLRYIIEHVWPKIHASLPDAQLHIYGSNSRQEFSDLDKLNVNIYSRGLMPTLERLAKYRVMLAPIRYGAGIKGKIVDSWLHKTPVVTGLIGAEGLFLDSTCEHIYSDINESESTYKYLISGENTQWPLTAEQKQKQAMMEEYYMYSGLETQTKAPEGLVFGGSFWNFTAEDYAKSAVELYTNEEVWKASVENGNAICRRRMGFTRNNMIYETKLNSYLMNLKETRRKNLLYNLTWSESMRSTQNFAKYINEKTRNRLLMKKH